MYHAEIPGTGQKSVHVQNNGGLTVLTILGPKDGIQARIWLDPGQARQVAAVLMAAVRRGEKVT